MKSPMYYFQFTDNAKLHNIFKQKKIMIRNNINYNC